MVHFPSINLEQMNRLVHLETIRQNTPVERNLLYTIHPSSKRRFMWILPAFEKPSTGSIHRPAKRTGSPKKQMLILGHIQVPRVLFHTGIAQSIGASNTNLIVR
jgi:hypothetical protein